MLSSPTSIILCIFLGMPLLEVVASSLEGAWSVVFLFALSAPAFARANKRWMNTWQMTIFMVFASAIIPMLLVALNADAIAWLLSSIARAVAAILVLGVNYTLNQRNMHRNWLLAMLVMLAEHVVGRRDERAVRGTMRGSRRLRRPALPTMPRQQQRINMAQRAERSQLRRH